MLNSSISAAASGTVARIIPANTSNAVCQPRVEIRSCPNGSIRNCPKDPPEDAMPSARLRRSGGNARPTTPRMTPKLTPLSPRPTISPALASSISGVVENGISARPPAYSSPETPTTRPAPFLSAQAPKNGCASPQIRFDSAIAKEKWLRPQPRSVLIGCRNNPKLARMPNPSVRMIAPQTSTRTGVRQLTGEFMMGDPSQKARQAYREFIANCILRASDVDTSDISECFACISGMARISKKVCPSAHRASPFILHPSPFTFHLSPFTFHLSPFTFHLCL